MNSTVHHLQCRASQVQKLYFVLNNNTCVWNPTLKRWIINFPREFVDSLNKDKSIIILNFVSSQTEDIISFHSETICDGNYHQDDHFITCYNRDKVTNKIYPIQTRAEYLTFHFKNQITNEILDDSHNFVIELKLLY